MSAWLRTRRVWSPWVALAACAVGLVVLHGQVLATPVVLGTDGASLWTTFLPLLIAMGVADCFSSKLQSAELRPSRRALLFDTAMLLAIAATGATLFATLSGPPESAAGAAGHVLVMTGLTCVVTLRGGAGAGTLAACALLIATTFYGQNAPAGAYVRILQPDGDPTWAFGVGLTTCLVAAVLLLVDGAKVTLGATQRPDD